MREDTWQKSKVKVKGAPMEHVTKTSAGIIHTVLEAITARTMFVYKHAAPPVPRLECIMKL